MACLKLEEPVFITGQRLQEMSLVCDRIVTIHDGIIDAFHAPQALDIQLPYTVQIHAKPAEALELECE